VCVCVYVCRIDTYTVISIFITIIVVIIIVTIVHGVLFAK